MMLCFFFVEQQWVKLQWVVIHRTKYQYVTDANAHTCISEAYLSNFVLSTSLYDCVFVGLSPLTNDAFVLTACWQRQYDRFSLMVTLCENCVLITSYEKYGAESPWTQAKQTVKQHVNNWGLAATNIHHHLSSASQCQTPRPLHPEPLIPFCNASSNFLGSHAKSLLRYAFSHARRNTSETTAIHQNANSITSIFLV